MHNSGDDIRKRNKLKAKNLMALAVSFADKATLAKVQKVFLNMNQSQMEAFKKFLRRRQYIRPEFANPNDMKIINQITQIALRCEPEDEFLKKAYRKYNQNLELIDELKKKSVQADSDDNLHDILDQINDYNEHNIKLLEAVQNFSNKKFASSK